MDQMLHEVLEDSGILRFLYEDARVNSMLIMDKNGYLLHHNHAFLYAFGYQVEDLQGKHLRVLFPEEDRKRLAPELEIERVNEHRQFAGRNYFLHKNGNTIWCSSESVLVYNTKGEPFIIKAIQDIHEQKLLERFLEESRQFNESLESAISDCLVVTDFNGRILRANQSFYEVFEIGPERLEGRQLFDLSDPFFSTGPFRHEFESGLSKGVFQNYEVIRQGKNKTARMFLIKTLVLEGKLRDKSLLVVFTDITEERKVQLEMAETARRFKLLTETMPQKVSTADSSGFKYFFNQHWVSYSGLSAEALKGTGWQKVIHPDDRQIDIDTWQESAKTGKDFELEHRIRRYDGEYRWHLARGLAQKDETGKVVFWVETDTDIHDLKRVEEKLEKRVGERTRELQQTNMQLEKTNEELRQFVYIVSHYLQEPLRKVQTFANFLNDRFLPNLPERGQGYVKKILHSTENARLLIRDFLEYANLARNMTKHSFKPVNLNRVLATVLAVLKHDIQAKDAQVKIGELPVIECVERQMNQVFFHLISNSLKFSSPNRRLMIEINTQEASEEEIKKIELPSEKKYYKIIIRDNGIGFEQEFAFKIFEMFHQLHTRGRFSGTGVGLALVKKIVDIHQGVIFSESKKNEGAVFTLFIPASQEKNQ